MTIVIGVSYATNNTVARRVTPNACDSCEPNMDQTLWWQYHLPVVLPQFWLVILLALLIRHGVEMIKEKERGE